METVEFLHGVIAGFLFLVFVFWMWELYGDDDNKPNFMK